MGTPPKLHRRLVESIEHFQESFDSALSPESDGGISITPFEFMSLGAELHNSLMPLVLQTADTMRLVGTAIDTGVESAWLARQMQEQVELTKRLEAERYEEAEAVAHLLVMTESAA